MDAEKSRWVKRFALAAATLGWAALAIQFWLTLSLSMARGKGLLGGLITYFSFFTILTNILAATALTASPVRGGPGVAGFFSRPTVQTGIAASIAVVGIAYSLLLQHLWDPKGLQLVADVVLHHVMPVLFLVYWWVAVRKAELRVANIPLWTLYPIVYFLFAMLRGALSGAYPYPFIDARQLGYPQALANAAGILLGFVAVALLLVASGRRKDAAT